MRKGSVAIAAIVGLIILAACGLWALSGGSSSQKDIAKEARQATRTPVGKVTYNLTIKNHRFTPDHLEIPEETRFFIALHNEDNRVDEFESYDMKFERIVPPMKTRIVHAGPLHLHRSYEFFDDFHPDETRGRVIVTPRSKS